jgi:hypothetical protein
MAGRISYLGGIVTQGLVLDLDAAKRDSYVGVGTAWNDISGNRNNGTLTNGPTFNSGNGGSIVFDGVDDYVIGNCPLINVNVGSCLSLWVKTSSINTQIIGSCDSGINNGFRFQIFNTTLHYTLGNVADYNTFINISNNTWRHIVASTLGSTALIYINGVLTNTLNIGIMLGNTSNFKLGAFWNNQFPFLGSISNFYLYNRALSASEVLQNYNATKGRYL